MSESRAIFISDLHLESEETDRHRALASFLESLRSRSEAQELIILGDLFHYWIGRASETAPGHRMVLEELARTVEAGVPVTLLHGNRDFLIDDGLEQRYGIKVLPHALSLELGEHRVYAIHGDTLLLDDRHHLRFRRVLRSGWLKALIECLPTALLARLAALVRAKSVRRTRRKKPKAFEVPPEAVARLFRGGYDVIICGHIHRESIRKMLVDDEERTFYSLGAWEEEGSVLEFDGEKFEFSRFPIG